MANGGAHQGDLVARGGGEFVLESGARRLPGLLAKGDRERFTELFEEVRRFFGPFTGEALEQSSFLIDRIIERT